MSIDQLSASLIEERRQFHLRTQCLYEETRQLLPRQNIHSLPIPPIVLGKTNELLQITKDLSAQINVLADFAASFKVSGQVMLPRFRWDSLHEAVVYDCRRLLEFLVATDNRFHVHLADWETRYERVYGQSPHEDTEVSDGEREALYLEFAEMEFFEVSIDEFPIVLGTRAFFEDILRAMHNEAESCLKLFGESSTASETDKSWLTVTEAARVSGLLPPVISRAATKGEFATNGKKGSGRRIVAASFTMWLLERTRKQEPAESDDAVKRKLERADCDNAGF